MTSVARLSFHTQRIDTNTNMHILCSGAVMIPSWPLLLSITGLAARSYISGGTGNGVARFTLGTHNNPHATTIQPVSALNW